LDLKSESPFTAEQNVDTTVDAARLEARATKRIFITIADSRLVSK
jgi:hypothetical protein